MTRWLPAGNLYFYPRSPCGERPPGLGSFKQRGIDISIHALLAESDTKQPPIPAPRRPFLSTLSLRRATRWVRSRRRRSADFYPRSPCGERPGKIRILNDILNFYPRSPCGERPIWVLQSWEFSTISIHALLAESDGILGRRLWHGKQFLSTLSLRRATASRTRWEPGMSFLSTLSLRRATDTTSAKMPRSEFLSTLSLRRATVSLAVTDFGKRFLSTLSLRRATDVTGFDSGTMVPFLSTLSLRRATSVTTSFQGGFAISIHALLAESD